MIDIEQLPQQAVIDTNVLILAAGERDGQPDAELARAFVMTMQQQRKRIYIAAPSLAEYLRFGVKTPTPMLEQMPVLAFDQRAADLLGKVFPERTLVEFKKNNKCSTLNYYKYDAMIVACVERWRIHPLVTLDDGLRELANLRSIPVATLDSFKSRQGKLALVPRPVEVAEKPEALATGKTPTK